MKPLNPEGNLEPVTMRCGEHCTCHCTAVLPDIVRIYNDTIALGNCTACTTTHKLILQPKAVIAFPLDPSKGQRKETSPERREKP